MNFEIVAPSTHFYLADLVAHRLDKSLIIPEVKKFADGELEIQFTPNTDFKGKKVFIIMATCPPVHDSLITFALLVHKVRMLGAQEIIGVIPYFGYGRHDKAQGSLAIIANIIEATNINKLIVFEPHVADIQSYFSIPVITVRASDLIATHIQDNSLHKSSIIAPDQGASAKVIAIAQKIGAPYTIFVKERYDHNATKIITQLNNEHDRCDQAIIIDDIIDTGSTALNTLEHLKSKGYKRVYGYFIHPVFSRNAQKIIEESGFEKVFVSTSIPLSLSPSKKIELWDMSNVLADLLKKELLT